MPGGSEEGLLPDGFQDADDFWIFFEALGNRVDVRRAEELGQRDLAFVGQFLITDAEHPVAIETIEENLLVLCRRGA